MNEAVHLPNLNLKSSYKEACNSWSLNEALDDLTSMSLNLTTLALRRSKPHVEDSWLT